VGSQLRNNGHWRFLFHLPLLLNSCLDVTLLHFLLSLWRLYSKCPMERQQGYLHWFHIYQRKTKHNGETLQQGIVWDNLFVFINMSREWHVWIYSADLLVNIDQQLICCIVLCFSSLINTDAWRLHATAECNPKYDLLGFTWSVAVRLLKTSTVSFFGPTGKRV